jgi:hypothetical protein
MKPSDYGRMGGRPTKFIMGKNGTQIDIASGKQTTLASSWGGLSLQKHAVIKGTNAKDSL